MMPTDLCRQILDRYAGLPLFEAGGAMHTIATGYCPPLVNYTLEDLQAKGLRKLEEQTGVQVPVYFSALEMAAREPVLFLRGARGSGKTTFLLHLALHLAGEQTGHAQFNLAALPRAVARNDEGDVLVESWGAGAALPLYVVATDAAALAASLEDARALLANVPERPFLLMIDQADRLGAAGPALLQRAAALAGSHPRARLLVAGSADVCDDWALSSAFRKLELLPLLAAQREQYRARFPGVGQPEDGDPAVLGNAGLFMLSLSLPPLPYSAYQLVEQRMRHAGVALGAALYADRSTRIDEPAQQALKALGLAGLMQHRFVQAYLAAQHLATLPDAGVAELVHAAPDLWRTPVRILARHLPSATLTDALLDCDGDAGLTAAVLAAELAGAAPPQRDRLTAALLQVVERGALSVALRAQAGRLLAALGDPRDLESLVRIDAGEFTMGATTHPNSAPPHQLTLPAYRIGAYPVSNRLYLAFIEASGRTWQSVDGRRPERANAPAVDLTWHDARACCAWLTAQWRASGKIGATESVRLPTEPEWEYAARAGQPDGGEAIVYPWPGAYLPGRANAEDAGFNDTCTVGLFPLGQSAWGCFDMAGQVWEWTTTLWGRDMAAPSFAYPYADDGREALGAAPDIRRVLRGGCFSSVREKACCTYRGSLEPNGFWRGNGFRVVVA